LIGIQPPITNVPIIAEPARWLGETFGFWIQTAVFAISAFAGMWIIRSRGYQEGRRATVDLIVQQKRDEKLLAARHCIMVMHEKGEKNLARHLENPDSEECKAILLALNTYEFVACGIKLGAVSERIYKRLRFSTVLKDWDAFEGFVIEFRRQRGGDTFFQDFEWLYGRWKKHPLKSNRKSK
jgi:hypothetical protein